MLLTLFHYFDFKGHIPRELLDRSNDFFKGINFAYDTIEENDYEFSDSDLEMMETLFQIYYSDKDNISDLDFEALKQFIINILQQNNFHFDYCVDNGSNGHLSFTFKQKNYLLQNKKEIQTQIDILTPFIDVSKIKEGIFLGNFETTLDKKWIVSNNITHILDVGSYSNIKPYIYNCKYLFINIIDRNTENISQYFDKTHSFIDDAIDNKGNIIIHCQAGVSRSATILISYFMKKYNKKFNDVYNEIKNKRPKIKPNDGFIVQLLNYEKTLNIDINNNSNTLEAIEIVQTVNKET